jgi:hypothetical protein
MQTIRKKSLISDCAYHEISLIITDMDGHPVDALTAGTAKGFAILPNGQRVGFDDVLDLRSDRKWTVFLLAADCFEVEIDAPGYNAEVRLESWLPYGSGQSNGPS